MTDWRARFVAAEALPQQWLAQAARCFEPLGQWLLARRSPGQTLIVGCNGSQGSGKSTVCAFLCEWLQHEAGLSALSLSLDDVYLRHGERQQLAQTVHPLLATRGVPATHDIALLCGTLAALSAPAAAPVAVPRFDKAIDDRRPQAAWDRVSPPLDVIFVEGWCLGARPQPSEQLAAPLNALEAAEDPDRRWRRYVNTALARDFAPLYAQIDCWFMLRAPSFDVVYAWRLEQEHKLAARLRAALPERDALPPGVMSDAQVARFIQHYERLTRHCLAALPAHMDVTFELDNERRVNEVQGVTPA
jgi:D-glycerate 3-kinase